MATTKLAPRMLASAAPPTSGTAPPTPLFGGAPFKLACEGGAMGTTGGTSTTKGE